MVAYVTTNPRRFARSRQLRLPPGIAALAEPVRFTARDGLLLSGTFIPAQPPSRAAVILVHGMAAERSQMEPWIPWLNQAGNSLLLFDLRGCGFSEGRICTVGLHEKLDLLGAVDYLASRPDCVDKPIGVLGYSFGGVVAIQAAAIDERIQFVISHSAYCGVERAVADRCSHHFGRFGPDVAEWAHHYGRRWVEDSAGIEDPESAIHAITPRPILIIGGALDPIVPPPHAEALYEAAGKPKRLLNLPNTCHSYPAGQDESRYREAIIDFVGRAVRASGPLDGQAMEADIT